MSSQRAWGGCVHAAHSVVKSEEKSASRSTPESWNVISKISATFLYNATHAPVLGRINGRCSYLQYMLT